MNFEQFKKEWANAMVYKPKEMEDFENQMHDLYVIYKESPDYLRGDTVIEWCDWFHAECDLDKHPYMVKRRALETHHANGLKKMANIHRKRMDEPLLQMIEKDKK